MELGYENTQKQDVLILDLLKCICCIMVVVIHFTTFCDGGIKIVIRSITVVAVPCFMSISGYLIFYRKKYKYKEILTGPFKRYIILFLIWYLVYCIMYYNISDETMPFLKYMTMNTDGWILWYIKVYVQILLVYPLVYALVKEEKTVFMYSILWLIFICCKFSAGVAGIPFTKLQILQLPFFQYSGYIGGTTAAFYPMEALGYFVFGGKVIYMLVNENHIKKGKMLAGGFMLGGVC